MKMNFLPARQVSGRPEPALAPRALLLFVAALLLYFFGSAAWLFADRYTPFLVRPLYATAGALTRAGQTLLVALRPQVSLLTELKTVTTENQELRLALLAQESVRAENEQLKNLAAGVAGSERSVRAGIIAKPPHLPHDELLLDVGRRALPALRPGTLVFLSPEVVLGEVVAVYGETSRVKIFSTAGNTLPVSIGPNRLPAVASGGGSGNFTLSLPRGVEIKPGDLIRTTLVGDYLLATVGAVIRDPNEPFQRVVAKSPLNIQELTWVIVGQ